MKKSIKLANIVLGATLFVGLTMTSETDAAILLHASQCSAHAVRSAVGGMSGGDAFLTNANGSQLTTQSGADVICPIVRVQGGSVAALVTIDVFKNASNGIVAKGCHTFIEGGGGACTPANLNLSTGVQHITIPEFAFNTQAYNYIHVTLGPVINGSFNTFFGYRHNT
jgi:hypothetical protein